MTSDNGTNNDITSTIFQSFKNAEPIIILASISLAIGALVAPEKKFLIYNYSVISSFMFIFSFGSYVIYELCKKYWYPSKELVPDEYAVGMSTYNITRFAPIYFAFVGFLFLIIIAYELGVGSTVSEDIPTNKPMPLFPLIILFFVTYFLIYKIIIVIKNLIMWKRTPEIPARNLLNFLVGQSILLSFLVIQEIIFLLLSAGLEVFSNLQDIVKYYIAIFAFYGILVIVGETIFDYRKTKTPKRAITKYLLVRIIISIAILSLLQRKRMLF